MLELWGKSRKINLLNNTTTTTTTTTNNNNNNNDDNIIIITMITIIIILLLITRPGREAGEQRALPAFGVAGRGAAARRVVRHPRQVDR